MAAAPLAVVATLVPYADDRPGSGYSESLARHLQSSVWLWIPAVALALLACAAGLLLAHPSSGRRVLPWSAIAVGASSILMTNLAVPRALCGGHGRPVRVETGLYLWGIAAAVPVVCGCWELLATPGRGRPGAAQPSQGTGARYTGPRIALVAAAAAAFLCFLIIPKDMDADAWNTARVYGALAPWVLVQGLLILGGVAAVTLVLRPSGRSVLAAGAVVWGLAGAVVMGVWHAVLNGVGGPGFVLGEILAFLVIAAGVWTAARGPAAPARRA